MKMTLLEMVQDILSSIEADEVNSISDIPEGTMVAYIIRNVYFDMLNWSTSPELKTAYFQLEGLSDTDRPNYLKLPDSVKEILWFKYDTQDVNSTQREYTQLYYVDEETFFRRVMSRDLSETEVVEITTENNIPLWIYNDRNPTFYTISDDQYIICDAYDSNVDATLQASKTVAAGIKYPTFTISDSYTPDIDDNLFPYLLAESKAIAFNDIKQSPNRKHESISREQKIRYQDEKHRLRCKNKHNTSTEGPHFGRRKP